MSTAKQINANTAVTAALATAKSATVTVSEKVRALSDSHGDKLSHLKEHPYVTKIVAATEILWTVLGFILLFHGAQFRNIFLCTQLLSAFCYSRVKGSVVALYSDVTKAIEKTFEDDADAKKTDDADAKKEPENKHAKKRQEKKDGGKVEANRAEDAAAAKKLLKVVDTDKVTTAVFEACVALMACHMTMEGGLARKAVITYMLVNATKDKIKGFLDFSENDDILVWLDLFLSFALYSIFGFIAIVLENLAFAIAIAIIGAQLVLVHGLRAAEGVGKLKEGETAEKVAASEKGLAIFGGLAAFGTLWQFWALMADSGMAWYFQLLYLPAVITESLVGLL